MFKDYVDRNRFGGYLKKGLDLSWTYYLQDCKPDEKSLPVIFNMERIREGRAEVQATTNDYRQNRYAGSLAFEVHLVAVRRQRQVMERDHVDILFANGPIIFLPRTSLGDEESMALILLDAYDVEVALPEPGWIEAMIAPEQAPIDQTMEDLRLEVATLVDEYKKLQEQRKQKREVLRLLFDRGTSLEVIVRDTLRELGGTVEDPTDPGQEDSWISIQIDGQMVEGVLEVKGTSKDRFNEEGLSQLLKWKHRGIELRRKNYKGIFIGNIADDRAPEQRSNPFSSNFMDHAQLQKAAVILTTDLYLAHQLKRAGLLNEGDFWRDLFDTNGIFDSKSYQTLLPPDSESI